MGQTVNLLAYAFGGSNPSLPTLLNAEIAQLVEHDLAKVGVASSSLVFRSTSTGALVQLVRIHACHAWGHGFESRTHRNPTVEKIQKHFGALVQLVRIHACHAWGHGFESRTHRQLTFASGALVQLVRIHACHAWGHGFESRTHRQHLKDKFLKKL